MTLNKLFNFVLKIGTLIFLLEPVWMLLPFAGFLYGNFLNLEFLKEYTQTAWLLYFIFPVQTLMPAPIVLSLIGLIIFAVGAIQIYTAKIRKSGLVRTWIYKKFRHPQYTGLCVFCVGFLLVWGRFITYILFFVMLFLYYLLAKKEEQGCLDQFGKEYEDYMKTTYFIFPGDQIFSGLGKKMAGIIPNVAARRVISLSLIMTIGISACFGILAVRNASMHSIPHAKAKFHGINGKDLEIILLKGFDHNYRRRLGRSIEIPESDEWYAKIADKLCASSKLKEQLGKYDINMHQVNGFLGFAIPRTVREKKSYYSQGRFDLMLLPIDSQIDLTNYNFKDFRKHKTIKGAIQINEIDSRRILTDEPEVIQGAIELMKPQPGEKEARFLNRMEMILNIYLSSYKKNIVAINQMVES